MSTVRPTQRSLSDLGLAFPPLDVPLHTLAHDLIAKAQHLPGDHAAGGAERVLAIADRLWFKVKVGEYRGAGGWVADDADTLPPLWWLVAGGRRRADSREQDFYGQLAAECAQRAKGTAASTSSEHLLPTATDVKRFEIEQATLGVLALQQATREAIGRSARQGKPVSATTRGQRLIAWVKTIDAETYLAISADGFLDHREVAIILNAVPGMNADDWQIEPGEILGITPGIGQLVYSALLPPTSLAMMLAETA